MRRRHRRPWMERHTLPLPSTDGAVSVRFLRAGDGIWGREIRHRRSDPPLKLAIGRDSLSWLSASGSEESWLEPRRGNWKPGKHTECCRAFAFLHSDRGGKRVGSARCKMAGG